MKPINWANLSPLSGTLDFDEASLDWAATDYGDLVHHRPLAVLRAGSADDIAAVLAFAQRRGLQVVPRAQGHSTAGQAQAPTA